MLSKGAGAGEWGHEGRDKLADYRVDSQGKRCNTTW